MLELIEGNGDIILHVEVNNYFLIIVLVYFDATVLATFPINIQGAIFSDELYEMIYMFFPNIFYSKIINNQ